MGGVAGPAVAAAVSSAGGLGIISALFQPPDAVRNAICEVREQTDAPFGVNLLLAPGVTTPIDPATLPADVVGAVTVALDGIREDLDLEPATAALPRLPALVEAAVDVVLDESVPVLSIGLGAPSAELVERAHGNGTKVMVMVTSVEDAVAMDRMGVDVVVAQGTEAGDTDRTSANHARVIDPVSGPWRSSRRWSKRFHVLLPPPAASSTAAGSPLRSRSAPPVCSWARGSWRPKRPSLRRSTRRPCSSTPASTPA
jgi:hypothetical protein